MMFNRFSLLWFSIVFFVALLLLSTERSHAKPWQGIIPLRSTSEDVVLALGISPTGIVNNYVIDDWELSFHYQYQAGEQACLENTRYYNVPAQTVVSIDITPTRYISLQELSINLKSFRLIPQRSHGRIKSGFYLLDEQSGMALTLNDDHSVDTITYLPSIADEEMFSCPNQPENKEDSQVEQKLHLSSILYSTIPNLEKRLLSGHIEDQMEILDELVLPLENEIFGYRLKYTLPDSDYLTIFNTILNPRIRHDWDPSAPIDLLNWGKVCFVVQTFMLEELATLLSTFLEIEDPVVQLRLLETLRKLGEKEARYEIIYLLEEESLSPNVEEAALDTLVEFQAEEAIPFLEKYIGTREVYTTHQALKGLIRIGGKKTVPGLLKALSLADHRIRKLAIQGLTAVGGPSAIEGLVQSLDLEDRYSDIRNEAVKGLIQLRATEHYPKFWKAMSNQNDADPGSPAFVALVSIGDAHATAQFFKKLQMRNPPFPEDIFQSLRDLDAHVLVPPLIDFLEHQTKLGETEIASERALKNIILFLKDMKAMESVPILMSLLNTGYVEIREKVIEALGDLGVKESIPTLKKFARVEPWTREEKWRLDPCFREQLQKLYPEGLSTDDLHDLPKGFTVGLCPVHPREPFMAGEAALAILKLGEKTLIPEIQAQWDSYNFSHGRLFSLNRHINLRLWAYLKTFQVQGYNRAPVQIVVQAFEKEAGARIILPNEVIQEEDKPFTSVYEQKKWHSWPNRGARLSLFQGIQEILEHLGSLTFIFEGQAIKIIQESQAKTWWKDHLPALLPKDVVQEIEPVESS